MLSVPVLGQVLALLALLLLLPLVLVLALLGLALYLICVPINILLSCCCGTPEQLEARAAQRAQAQQPYAAPAQQTAAGDNV